MRDRAGSWHGARLGSPGGADPAGGRHALDQEAALTPIFTTMRRGGWRPPRPLRAVPDPPPYDGGDPPTMLLPVVPATPARLHPVPETPAETTTWYPLPTTETYAGPVVEERVAYRPAAYRSEPYEHYDPYEGYGPGPEDSGPYHLLRPEPAAHHPGPHPGVTDSGRHHRRLAPAGW